MTSRGSDGSDRAQASLHSILGRQLRALNIDPSAPDRPEWLPGLLDAVGSYYRELETTRSRLEGELRSARDRTQTLEGSIRTFKTLDLGESTEHYLDLFERTPIPTWEEDFQEVARWLDELRSQGVEDLQAYFDENPDEIRHGVSLIEVTNVNPAAALLVGVPDEVSLLGPLSAEVVDEGSAPSFRAQMTGIWEGVDSLTTPVVGSRFNGETFDGLIEWRVLRSGGGLDYSRVLVTIVDITAQKATEREALATLKSRDEMIASVTHELRTPLTSVLGFAEILRAMDQGDYEEERDGLLGIIANQAADLSDLVEDLLTSARSELGQLEVVSVPVNVHAQIAQALESRPPADRDVSIPTRSDDVVAQGDPQRVRQILRNLITNALRYGGPNIAVEVEPYDRWVAVRVLDDGKGLVPEAEDRIFERYFRDESGPAHPGSVGLGLNISLDLAHRMGGELSYRRRGGWTVFELTLPRLLRD